MSRSFFLYVLSLHVRTDSADTVMQVLEILGRWPLLARNKIENCKIDTLLTEIVERGGNPEIQALATTVSHSHVPSGVLS